jgi:hypothetical protein
MTESPTTEPDDAALACLIGRLESMTLPEPERILLRAILKVAADLAAGTGSTAETTAETTAEPRAYEDEFSTSFTAVPRSAGLLTDYLNAELLPTLISEHVQDHASAHPAMIVK